MHQIETLYLQYKDDLYRYLFSLTHNHTLSEDLLMETFLTALKSLSSFRGEASVKTWLFGIARNLWLQSLRQKGKMQDETYFLTAYMEEKIEDNLIAQQIQTRIEQLLAMKDKRTQTIIQMRMQAYAYSEIARRLNISENSARVIDHRTKNYLKAVLKKEGFI